MKDAQKYILIAKMLEAPSSLSDEEVDMIVQDDELRDIYEMNALVAGAYISQPEFDVREEWNKFRPSILQRPKNFRKILRIAAIFVGLVISVAIAFSLLNRPMEQSGTLMTKAEENPPVDNIISVVVSSLDSAIIRECIESPVRNNVKSSPKLIAKAAINESVDSLPIIDIDLEEYARIEQAKIDNDIAMSLANIYMAEYDMTGVILPEDDNNEMILRRIRMITLQ